MVFLVADRAVLDKTRAWLACERFKTRFSVLRSIKQHVQAENGMSVSLRSKSTDGLGSDDGSWTYADLGWEYWSREQCRKKPMEVTEA